MTEKPRRVEGPPPKPGTPEFEKLKQQAEEKAALARRKPETSNAMHADSKSRATKAFRSIAAEARPWWKFW